MGGPTEILVKPDIFVGCAMKWWGVKFMSNQCQLIVINNRFKIYTVIIVGVCFGIKPYYTFDQNSKKNPDGS